MIFVPIVLMMRWPPAIVPSPIASAHETTTHWGTCPSAAGAIHAGRDPAPFVATNETSARVMMPMLFCASFEPCANAIALADASCNARDPLLTDAGRILRPRMNQIVPVMTKNASTNPKYGETTSGTSTFFTRVPQLKWLQPACVTTAPARPPMSACDELDGMPYHHVMRFHAEAPMSAASTTVCVTSLASAKPDAMVLATAVPVMAPTKLSTPAM